MTWQSTFELVILIYFFVVNGTYTALTFIAFFVVRNQHRRSYIDDYPHIFESKLAPGVSLLMPAHNEETTIVESVRSLLMSRYPLFEVVVIDDGSEDSTLDRLIEEFGLRRSQRQNSRLFRDAIETASIRGVWVSPTVPNLVVISKENGGKADALNAGMNACKYPYFFSMDADIILEEDAILRVVAPIMRDPDRVVAAGGMVRVVNGCEVKNGQVVRPGLSKKTLPVLQVIEYIRAFSAGRAGLSAVDSLMIISGAFGVYSSQIARQVGGYSTETVGEDMELLVRMRKTLFKDKVAHDVLYQAYPVAWTEVPENLRILSAQRRRWHRGLCETMWKNRDMIFRPRYKAMGIFAMPFFFFVEFLGPLAEVSGYIYLIWLLLTGGVDQQFFLLFLSLAVLWGVFLSFSAILFEDVNFNWYRMWRSLGKLLPYALFENLGYRQLTAWWRVCGFFEFVVGKRGWGKQERQGFGNELESELETGS